MYNVHILPVVFELVESGCNACLTQKTIITNSRAVLIGRVSSYDLYFWIVHVYKYTQNGVSERDHDAGLDP